MAVLAEYSQLNKTRPPVFYTPTGQPNRSHPRRSQYRTEFSTRPKRAPLRIRVMGRPYEVSSAAVKMVDASEPRTNVKSLSWRTTY